MKPSWVPQSLYFFSPCLFCFHFFLWVWGVCRGSGHTGEYCATESCPSVLSLVSQTSCRPPAPPLVPAASPLAWLFLAAICFHLVCCFCALALVTICRDTGCVYTQKQDEFGLDRCHQLPMYWFKFVLPQQSMRVTGIPCPCQMLVLSIFLILSIWGSASCNFTALLRRVMLLGTILHVCEWFLVVLGLFLLFTVFTH